MKAEGTGGDAQARGESGGTLRPRSSRERNCVGAVMVLRVVISADTSFTPSRNGDPYHVLINRFDGGVDQFDEDFVRPRREAIDDDRIALASAQCQTASSTVTWMCPIRGATSSARVQRPAQCAGSRYDI